MNVNIKQINVKRSYTKPSGKVMLETAWKRVATSKTYLAGDWTNHPSNVIYSPVLIYQMPGASTLHPVLFQTKICFSRWSSYLYQSRSHQQFLKCWLSHCVHPEAHSLNTVADGLITISKLFTQRLCRNSSALNFLPFSYWLITVTKITISNFH